MTGQCGPAAAGKVSSSWLDEPLWTALVGDRRRCADLRWEAANFRAFNRASERRAFSHRRVRILKADPCIELVEVAEIAVSSRVLNTLRV